MNQNLVDFFQKRSQPERPIDWNERRDKYLADVMKLYDQIEEMLAESIKQKSVTSHRRPKELTENYIGTYSIDDLILLTGMEQVRFSPRGRNIVGAAGRVDVVGDRGEVALIMLPDSGWGVVQTRQPKLEIAPFDEARLADILQLVMRD